MAIYGWKKAYLSLSGRLTIVWSCLSRIPSYFLSISKSVVKVATMIVR